MIDLQIYKHYNGTVHIRNQCRKTTNCLKLPQMSSLDWCRKNEQHFKYLIYKVESVCVCLCVCVCVCPE